MMSEHVARLSGIFSGSVMHKRLRPKIHQFRYSVFSLLLDIDKLTELDRAMRLFGYNRSGLISFHDKDHGDGRRGGLRQWVEVKLAEAGITEENPSIFILCYPRVMGYVFNPLTLYFCYSRDQRLLSILYEVGNTFGERHTYIIPAPHQNDDALIQQRCAKAFYVSPFMAMDCFYNFTIHLPDEKVMVRIDEEDQKGPLLIASFAGTRSPLNDKSLARAFLRHPLMTLKVSAGIHWEALRLWRKGISFYSRKAAAQKVAATVVTPSSSKDHAHE